MRGDGSLRNIFFNVGEVKHLRNRLGIYTQVITHGRGNSKMRIHCNNLLCRLYKCEDDQTIAVTQKQWTTLKFVLEDESMGGRKHQKCLDKSLI